MVGPGVTVIVNIWGVPVQPPRDGVTVMVAEVGAETLAVVKLISPLQEAPRPMAVLLLVHA